MRLASWNINGLRARFDFLLHWLAAREPDVVGLQELKLEDDKFPRAELERAGYYAVSHGQKAWNGVAVLSRRPAEVVRRGLPGQEDLGARLLTVAVDDLIFSTIYCPNGKHFGHEDFGRKLAWLDALVELLGSDHDPERAEVLCGDFNICPAAIDSWNEGGKKGTIFHTDEERARFRRIVEWGYVDVFRACHPETQAFSWWDYRGGAFHRNQGLRIDVVLVTDALASRVAGAEIDRDYRKKKDGLTASDHAPVWIDVEE